MKKQKVSDLKHSKYNPRKISPKKLESLKKALYEFGDLSGIIFNQRSGNLIGGHQRCKIIPLDAVIEKTELQEPSRTGTIAEGFILIDGEKYTYREVDWDKTREKAANLAANKHGGEWDEILLEDIITELSLSEIDIGLTGFDEFEIASLLGEEKGSLEEKTEILRPYKQTHILLSFSPEKLMEIKPHLEQILKIENIEYEQSSN